ncbi:RNA polymerase sigma factor [Hanstruepera flava]|uniref:RNA polymerase sigma factor n=1 Tax=Hanstruepera flava TaxID=2930218 RepID=UPI002027D08F|nr:sigma-70 family RNA polymerase sigma factor [Hanstruepera flava]
MPKNLHDNVCDENIFSNIYKRHSKDLHNFLYYKYGDKLNPQDKVQEAFVKLWENCKKILPKKAKSFLFTVGNNLMLNEVAHHKVVLKFQETKPQSIAHETPQFLMEEKEYMLKLQTAISSLTEAQRVAFLMNRIEGKKHKEIAELLNISTKAVEKRIYGALKQLRQEIEGI